MSSEPGKSSTPLISAADLANYVVCPEAWRLKYVGAGERQENDERVAASQEIRAEWARNQALSGVLGRYSRVAFFLLILLTITAFVFEWRRSEYLERLLRNSGSQGSALSFNVPTELVLLILVLGLVIFMWDLFERRGKSLRKITGMNEKAETIAVKGSSQLPAKAYTAIELGLRGKPDAVVREKNQIIPVDIHPLANKIRDRHVVQMLAHLRLIEECEGVRPEHGILLMGKMQRKVLLKNTPEKQRWLETLVDEMHSIMDGIPAVPSPTPQKCRACDVRSICAHSAAAPVKLKLPAKGGLRIVAGENE